MTTKWIITVVCLVTVGYANSEHDLAAFYVVAAIYPHYECASQN